MRVGNIGAAELPSASNHIANSGTPLWRNVRFPEVAIRIGTVLLIVWLVIGAIAGAQRHYYSGTTTSCEKAGTIAVTVLAGPLNYAGVNPKVTCTPSK